MAEQKHAHQDSAAGFGPEIKFSHLSLAFSLILSGVSQTSIWEKLKKQEPAAGAGIFLAGGSPQAGCELGGPSAGKSPPRRPEAPQGRSRGPPPKSRGAPKKTARTHTKTAAGFGPEIKFSHLSLAFSLILSGVSQIEVSFGKKDLKQLSTLRERGTLKEL